eukprot:CAMPEP_0170392818 /NCGR_PEP_ID=MMETSP0117_2-20130122/20394_1 /TAXON_ID=400756 /ORGANISM="Durinskia baltica, Strain CSIRO CS-38" /LENGTH=65 /DNA_ID=CAMNT_0010648979 /DNA_START=54 /DNA_END=248 /DNA_ORIENTATION=-
MEVLFKVEGIGPRRALHRFLATQVRYRHRRPRKISGGGVAVDVTFGARAGPCWASARIAARAPSS